MITVRQREVIELVAEGKQDKEIGKILGISPNTVQKHLVNFASQLHLRTGYWTRSYLVAYCIRNGIIE